MKGKSLKGESNMGKEIYANTRGELYDKIENLPTAKGILYIINMMDNVVGYTEDTIGISGCITIDDPDLHTGCITIGWGDPEVTSTGDYAQYDILNDTLRYWGWDEARDFIYDDTIIHPWEKWKEIIDRQKYRLDKHVEGKFGSFPEW